MSHLFLRTPLIVALLTAALAAGSVSGALFAQGGGPPQSIDDSPDSAFMTFAAMAPGDSVIQPLTISNSGTLEFRYAMTTSATNTDTKNLRDELDLTIREKTANPCSSEDGLVLFGPAGILSSGAFGSSAQGAQAGDRTLAASASEVLCFKVELPLATGAAFQGATTTATFTFDAEQTANNS